jgi:hypothetical protein
MFGSPTSKFRSCVRYITARLPALTTITASILLFPGVELRLVLRAFTVQERLQLLVDHCPEGRQGACLLIPRPTWTLTSLLLHIIDGFCHFTDSLHDVTTGMCM